MRTSRQEQNYSSIVSTLLALMDGLDSRGDVVIIGATVGSCERHRAVEMQKTRQLNHKTDKDLRGACMKRREKERKSDGYRDRCSTCVAWRVYTKGYSVKKGGRAILSSSLLPVSAAPQCAGHGKQTLLRPLANFCDPSVNCSHLTRP